MLRFLALSASLVFGCSSTTTNDTNGNSGGSSGGGSGGSAGQVTGGAGGSGGTGAILDAGDDALVEDAGGDATDAAAKCTDLTSVTLDFDPCTNNCLSAGTCADDSSCGSDTLCSFFGFDAVPTDYGLPFKGVCAGALELTHVGGGEPAQLEIYGVDPELGSVTVLKTILSEPCGNATPKSFTLPAPATDAIMKVPPGLTVYLDDVTLEK
jgi:hypothetical protein